MTISGVIEGFYGRPWSWAERVEVMAACHGWGMSHYVYAPKDDPRHRERWREPYDGDELDGFASLVAEGTLEVGFGISPGLTIDYDDPTDLAALAGKVDQVLATGMRLVCLALDDIPFGGGPQGKQHASLATWLRDRLGDRAGLVLVPTEYVGTRASPYLDELAAGVPADVPIAWTGAAVVNDGITADDARSRADSLGGRPALLWDNFPVNDGMMADRLHLGPLWGRDPDLPALCSGWLANPMVQPRASLLPLASVAALLRGEDPLDVWAAEAANRGWRVFAEACDGAVPQALVRDLVDAGADWPASGAAVAEWLQAAEACAAPGLEEEAETWLDQVRREARVALAAVRLVQCTRPLLAIDDRGQGRVAAPDQETGLLHAGMVWLKWPRLSRSGASVLGVRRGFRPQLAQAADGRWAYLPTALLEDQNAVDALCRFALDGLAGVAAAAPRAVVVEVDGAPVRVANDGTFTAPPGSSVVARWGDVSTRVRAPASPPLPDPRLP